MNNLDAGAYAITWAIIDSLWQFLLVGGVLRLLLWVSPNGQSALRYHISVAALVLCCGWWLSNVAFHWMEFQNNSKSTTTETVIIANENNVTAENLSPVVTPNSAIENVESQAATTPERPKTTFQESAIHWISSHKKWLMSGWMLGVLVLFGRFLGSWWYLKKLRSHQLKKVSEAWQQHFQQLKKQLNIAKNVQFALSPLVKEPITFGHFKPIILIPIGLINHLSTDEVEAILLHELAHIQRHDFLVNALQSCLEIILFYHPMLWWMNKTIRDIREECCDDVAIQIQKNEQTYAKTLLAVQKYSIQQHFLTTQNHLVMTATGKKSALTKRVHRLFNTPKRQQRRFSLPLFLLFLVVGSLTLFAFQNARNQPSVSISVDKMKIFYMGVDNPITVAAEGITNDKLQLTSEDVELTPLGNGQYNVKPLQVGKAIITVESDNMKRDMEFTVKRIPDPLPTTIYNGIEAIYPKGGWISAGEMKAMVGVSTINQTEYEVDCEVVGFEMTRVPMDGDPITEPNRTGQLKGRVANLVQLAATGDVFYFDEIHVKCPDDEEARDIEGMVFKIK